MKKTLELLGLLVLALLQLPSLFFLGSMGLDALSEGSPSGTDWLEYIAPPVLALVALALGGWLLPKVLSGTPRQRAWWAFGLVASFSFFISAALLLSALAYAFM